MAKRFTNGFEVSAAVALVRLEIIALRPFVPRLEKHQAALRRPVCNQAQRMAQVVAKKLWRGFVKNPPPATHPGGIVPVWHDAGMVIVA
jgi:hypothetical protein